MRIGYAFCASFCTHARSLDVLKKIRSVYSDCEIVPIISENAATYDTKFGKAENFVASVREISENEPIMTIPDAEVLGPTLPLDVLVISPCTGNTLAKIASGITDTTVTMATKAHLRSNRPCLIALATNDAMSANLKNIASALLRKNVYFVPLLQDAPKTKPHSLVADFDLIPECLELAISGEQMRPLFK